MTPSVSRKRQGAILIRIPRFYFSGVRLLSGEWSLTRGDSLYHVIQNRHIKINSWTAKNISKTVPAISLVFIPVGYLSGEGVLTSLTDLVRSV